MPGVKGPPAPGQEQGARNNARGVQEVLGVRGAMADGGRKRGFRKDLVRNGR